MEKVSKNYTVYKIEIDGVVKYIGYSISLHTRQYQHNSDMNNPLSKKYSEKLYKWLREHNITKVELIPICEFKNKVQAKRYECYLLLQAYFDNKFTMVQNIPALRDGY